MKSKLFVRGGAMVAAWVLAMMPIAVSAQASLEPIPQSTTSARVDWQDRVLRRPAAKAPGGAVAGDFNQSQANLRWLPYRPEESRGLRQAGYVEAAPTTPMPRPGPSAPEVIPPPEALSSDPTPEQIGTPAPLADPIPQGQWVNEPPGAFEEVGGPCQGPSPYQYGEWECSPFDGCGGRLIGALHNFTFFGGMQGFKGPVDLGTNGNFGVHEGLNFGAPLGDPWGSGYQLGVQGVQSDFAGSTNGLQTASSRRQFFFTGGIFNRAPCGGFQGGVVFDYVHDTYYDNADLRQIRSETAYVLDGGVHEIGYFGAYGINKQRFQTVPNDTTSLLTFQPNDVFAGFYRRHFSGGGQGRLWAGGTGAGEGILGGEATVPLGTSWALENNFVYVAPKASQANGGREQESWSVSVSLVWYPGRAAGSVFKNPFQPLLGVGDNSAFLVRRGAD